MEYRVNKQAVEKKPGTKSPEVKEMLGWEPDCMELLLLYEVRRWEEFFSNKFKAFLNKIGNDRLEEKERLTREWRANRWKRLSPQMHAAQKRMADVDYMENKNGRLEIVRDQWAISINQIFERVDDPIMSLSNLRILIGGEDKERRLRFENEIEDAEFRLKRGSVLGRFDQFWDDDALFRCRYSRSKWLDFYQGSTVPLEIYSHALKGNKNITHITFAFLNSYSDFDVIRFLCDLPWVTSINSDLPVSMPAVHCDLLFTKSITNNLNAFAKEIKLEPSSTYIFSDVTTFDLYSDKLGVNARILISFVAPQHLAKVLY